MIIAMFGHKRIPGREGGVEVVVEELTTRMVERGHHVICYNRKGHHVSGSTFDTPLGDSYKGVRILPVWTVDIKGLSAMTSSLSAALTSSLSKADVVHIHGEGPAAMCFIPKFRSKRVIVTIHGLDWARSKWGRFASRYIKWGEKQAVKYADEIIVLSRAAQEYFMREYSRKTVYIPNGVKRSNRVEADVITRKWGLKRGDYILFLGRIVPEKGLNYLIDAWKGLKTNKKLVIAGGSSDSQDYYDELKTIASEEVIFTGFQQGRILEELYSNCYIYCLPSDIEGMPLSLLEAMSYGNCCLVSDIPECTEVTENKAVKFRKSDVNDLKDKLQMLIDDSRIVDQYSKEASEHVCTKYDWNDVVDQTLRLYCNE